MKLSKIALAAAALAAIASGSTFAGQIDSSSTTLAREVIWSDTAQTVRAPSKSYSFIGLIDARNNEQRLQLQWTLSGGLTWASGTATGNNGDVALTAGATTNLPIAGQEVLKLNGKDLANANIGFGPGLIGALTGAVTVDAFVNLAATTLYFNITIPQGATNYIKDAVFQLNAKDFSNAVAAPTNVGVKNALAASGAMACVGPDTNTQVNFKHFTNHNGNISPQSGDITTNPDSEHLRAGSTNDGRFLNFTENLKLTFANGVQSQTDAATLRTTLLRSTAETASYATAAATLAVPATRLHRIATGIDLSKVASGLDLDYTTQYGKTGTFLVGDFNTVNPTTPLANVDGTVNLASLVVSVTTPQGYAGWAAGSTIAILDSADAAIAGATVSPPTAANFGVATVTFTTAAQAAAFANSTGSKLYYVLTGAAGAIVPQTGLFNVTATLGKTKAGPTQERDNVCKADLAGIGGGLKIDIRNYASRAKYPTGNYTSIVRLINNSESQSADIFAQMIYADGTYGPYGQLPNLAPRAVANYTNAQLEAFMTTAAPVANPFGSSTVYTQTPGATVGVGSASTPAGVGDRVRFVSNSGTTLRVQSYLALPNGTVLDTSNAQGVDFENTSNNRSPVSAVDAQPNSQDAINGLAK